jgi:cell division protein FtsB
MNAVKRSWKYVLAVVGLVMSIWMIIDFNSRMAEVRRLSTEKERVSARATSLVETKTALETQIAYATSEAAVQAWARQDNRMAQPGDTVVIPLPPPNSTPIPTPTPAVTPRVVTSWEVWLSLFVDVIPSR